MRTDPGGLMIFAAGRGMRMRPLTDRRPKCLVKVAGRAMLDRALDIGTAAGATPIVVNAHHMSEQIAAHLAGQNVALLHEPDLLETGGGLKAALGQFPRGSVFTLNSDAVWSGANPLQQLRDAWRPGVEALLLLNPAEGAGDFSMDDTGRISRGGPWRFTGAQIITTAPVARHPGTAFSLNAVWDRMIAAGTAFGCVHDGLWCDVGTPDAVARAETMLGGGHG